MGLSASIRSRVSEPLRSVCPFKSRFRSKQHSLCDRRTVETGLGDPFAIHETGLLQHGQELLSRYGAPLSCGPFGDPGPLILREITGQDLIGHHEAATGFQDPVDFF